MSTEEQLSIIREKIDAVDAQLQALINERARYAQQVGEIKQQQGDPVFYRPEREAQILRSVMQRNEGPMPDEEMARLFREIISTCLALEKRLKVAFLGPEGTYTQTAALKHFGHAVDTVPMGAIDEVFREVEAGGADYGVVPIENSTEGMVNHTLDTFVQSNAIKICGEVELRIHHHLLSKETDLSKIKRIYSHQQSFAQCREWLNANFSGVEHHVVSSNARAAQLAAEEEGSAAIAGETAAELYHLQSLVANIEDDPNNTTRFLVIGTQETRASGKDKTSLLLSVKNRPGALYALLEPFRRHGISLTRIESRPSRRQAWEYVFFVDLEGHVDDDKITQALKEVGEDAAMLSVLGSYPCAVMKG